MGDDVYAFPDEITSLAFYSTQPRSLSSNTSAWIRWVRPQGLSTLFTLFLNYRRSDSDSYLQLRVSGHRFYARKRCTHARYMTLSALLEYIIHRY